MTRKKKAATSAARGKSQCLHCSVATANECGPDGVRTLCADCCGKYRHGALTIFQKANGKCSVKAEKAVRAVTKYEFLSTKPDGKSYSTNHIRLNPVVLQATPVKAYYENTPAENNTAQLSSVYNTRPAGGKRPRQEPVLCVVADEKGTRPAVDNVPESVAKRHCARAAANDVVCIDHSGSSVPASANAHRSLRENADNTNGKASGTSAAEHSTSGAGLHVNNTQGVQKMTRNGRWHSVKACYMSERGVRLVHRFKLEESPHYETLLLGLKFIFKIEGKVGVFYEDDEGDQISLTSDNEMMELFDLARKHSISPIRMKVVLRGSS